MVFQDHGRLFFPGNAQFSNFFTRPRAIIADKTRFIPLLEQNPFEYMFLRPRRWGKSTFLNMLAAYYDVKTTESFGDIFGGLEIGKQPTKWHNQHLILLFNFSTITTVGSLEEIKQSVFDNISRSLHRFLLSYQDILGGGLLDGDALLKKLVIPGSIATSLTNVLVSKFGAGVYRGTKHDNRNSFTDAAIPLSLASTSTMPRPTLV
jgi:Predicted AAA-ATPase